MNYVPFLVGFRNQRKKAPIGKNAILLYFILWEYINEYRLPTEGFKASNTSLQANSGLSRRDLDSARNELKLNGYIGYTKGKGNQCGTYLFVRIDTQIDTQSDTQNDTQSDTQIHHINNTKQNKTKQDIDMSNDISSADYRQRYTSTQLLVIDTFFDVLKHTRKSAKLADSVILGIYQDWEKHEPEKVVFCLNKYISNPKLHDKKENYVMGIIRNTTMADVSNAMTTENNVAVPYVYGGTQGGDKEGDSL